MKKLNIEYRDPVHLRNKYTPALKRLPELPDSATEFLAFCSGLKKAGFTRPILLDENEQVIDDHSRMQLRAALRWQMKEVPVQLCSSADAPMLLIHSMAHVRHLSKSAIAYLAYPNLAPAMEASRLRRLENLRKGQEIPESCSVAIGDQTAEELGIELGIGRELLRMARDLHAAFKKYPGKYCFNVAGGAKDGATVECTLKDGYEPKLLQAFVGSEHEQKRPLGLGGILAGIESVVAENRDKFSKKNNSDQMELKLWEDPFKPLNAVAPSWKKLDEEQRDSVLKHWARTVRKLPDDLREKMAEKVPGQERGIF